MLRTTFHKISSVSLDPLQIQVEENFEIFHNEEIQSIKIP